METEMADDSDYLNDSRFSHIVNDPKFRKIRKYDRKVKIDKRFQSMFTNKSFKVKYSVDKRGRPISGTTTEDFRKFYDLSSEDEAESARSAESEADEQNKIPKNKAPVANEKMDQADQKSITKNVREKLRDLRVDYARGESALFSESSSDEPSSDDDSDEDGVYHEWNELDKDADLTDKITNRLAVCNMDWDRIRAVDLMLLFNSFLASGASVQSVVIYPSDYGLKRMQEEERHGPAELVNKNKNETPSSSDEDEDEDLRMERTREYQLNRLKYYYAIATFDSATTANLVYENCNGVEYESSAIRMDLRFVDDDITFEQEPKDTCDNINDCEKYKPRYFTNSALQQAKVTLTWDETDPKRAEFTQKMAEAAKSGDINDSDIEEFVALSSSDEDEDAEDEESQTFEENTAVVSDSEDESAVDPIERYRNLMKELEDEEKARENSVELEITWGAGDENEEKTEVISKNEVSFKKDKTAMDRQEKEVKKKDESENLTPFQQLIEKKKQKSMLKRERKLKSKEDIEDTEIKNTSKNRKLTKKNRDSKEDGTNEELDLLLMQENEDPRRHFSLKKIQENESTSKKNKKKLKKKIAEKKVVEDDFEVNVNDERFNALYTSHLFNIDPSDPKFHRTKGMEAFINEKQKKRMNNEFKSELKITNGEAKNEHVLNPELSSLVKSVKRKAKSFTQHKLKKFK